MCGRYSLYKHLHKLDTWFRAELSMEAVQARYNAAPGQNLPVVYQVNASRKISPLRWGLIASGQHQSSGFQPINARSETVTSKWPFKNAYNRQQRCLIPASGFFEWKQQAGHKQPWHIYPVQAPFFAFAGLYEIQPTGDATIESFTILTTKPNNKIAPLHHRMPVILSPGAFDIWLEPNPIKEDTLAELCSPVPDDAMDLHPVSTRVNKVIHDDPGLVKKVPEHTQGKQTGLFE